MVNPFTAFLNPEVRPIQGAPGWGELEGMASGQRREVQTRLENDQANTRANSYLKLQQDQQARSFAKDDQKEIEGLIAEYQNAAAKGDPAQIADVVQRLKRFGMDVSQGAPPLDPLSNLQALTGEAQLSPEDFEAQLAAGSPGDAPSDTVEPDIAGHLRSVGPLKALKLNTPEEQQAEPVTGEVIDLDAEDSTPLEIGGQEPAPLATQSLPSVTRISKGGKSLYESSSKGRYSPLVASVFEPLTQHENPEVVQAAQRAKGLAEKLVTVDGISPRDAIEFASKRFEAEVAQANQLERTRIGSRRVGGGAGGVPGVLGPKEDRAESIDKYGDNIETAIQHAGIPASNEKLTAAENAIMSDDPALQRDALKMLLQARSGLTVSEGERRSYTGVDGLMPMVQNQLLQWTGQPMTAVTRQSLLKIIQNMRNVNAETIKRITEREKRRYLAQNKDKVAPERLQERAGALAGDEPQEYGGL